MAVTVRSILGLKNEVYNGGGPNDLGHYGQIWFGRSNCNLNEFLGRSWWKSISLPGNINGIFHSVDIPDRGTASIYIQYPNTVTEPIGPDGGGGTVNISGLVFHSNTAPWSSFNYVNIPGIGNVSKNSFIWNGSFWVYSTGMLGSGTYTFWYSPT